MTILKDTLGILTLDTRLGKNVCKHLGFYLSKDSASFSGTVGEADEKNRREICSLLQLVRMEAAADGATHQSQCDDQQQNVNIPSTFEATIH